MRPIGAIIVVHRKSLADAGRAVSLRGPRWRCSSRPWRIDGGPFLDRMRSRSTLPRWPSLIGLYMLPGVAIALPGGMLGQRLRPARSRRGVRRPRADAARQRADGRDLVVCGRHGGTARSPAPARCCSMCMFTKMIADWFAGREIVTAMAILVTSWPFGLAIGLLAFGPLARGAGLARRDVLGAIAAFAALVLVAALYRASAGCATPTDRRASCSISRAASGSWSLISAAIWGFMNVGYIIDHQLHAGPFRRARLFAARGERDRQRDRLGADPLDPGRGLPLSRAHRPAHAVHARRILASRPWRHSRCRSSAMPLIAFGFLVFAIGVPAGMIMALPAQSLRPESRATGMGIFFTCY